MLHPCGDKEPRGVELWVTAKEQSGEIEGKKSNTPRVVGFGVFGFEPRLDNVGDSVEVLMGEVSSFHGGSRVGSGLVRVIRERGQKRAADSRLPLRRCERTRRARGQVGNLLKVRGWFTSG